MKFEVSRGALNSGISVVLGAVVKNHSFDVLSMMRLTGDSTGVTLEATNMELKISYRLECAVENPGPAVCVDAFRFGDIVKKLDPNSNVRIEVDHEEVAGRESPMIKINSARSRFKIQGKSIKDYPQVLEGESPDSFKIDAQTLLYGIKKTHFSIYPNDTRFNLSGILLHTQKGEGVKGLDDSYASNATAENATNTDAKASDTTKAADLAADGAKDADGAKAADLAADGAKDADGASPKSGGTGDEQSYLVAVSTDGHRLSLCRMKINDTSADVPRIIVPKKAITEIKKVLQSTEDGEVTVSYSSNQLTLKTALSSITTKLIAGDYPDYTKVIPDTTSHLICDNKTLSSTVQRVAAIYSDSTESRIRITIANNIAKITASKNEVDYASDEVEVEHHGPEELSVCYNYSYLLEILANVGSEKVKMLLKDNSTPAILRDTDSGHYLYILMSMRDA